MYDPTVGRWLQEDPSGFDAGDTNLGRYVENSPTNYTDPTGLRLVVAGKRVEMGDAAYQQVINKFPKRADVEEILERMINTPDKVKGGTFQFTSLNDLIANVGLRVYMIQAASTLNNLDVKFVTSNVYSSLTDKDAFKLWEPDTYSFVMKPERPGIPRISPAHAQKAMDELLANISKVEMECASAMIFVINKAAIDFEAHHKMPSRLTSRWDFQYNGADSKLSRIDESFLIPGDQVYITYPSATNISFRGENLLYLGRGLYYGHGAGQGKGISTADEWLKIVEQNGKGDAKRPPVFESGVTRPTHFPRPR